MPEHVIIITNPDGSTVRPHYTDLKYNGKFQRYGDAKFSIHADYLDKEIFAIHDNAWVTIYRSEQIARDKVRAEPVWKGILIPGQWKDDRSKQITAWSIERQLEFRPCPPVRYNDGHTILEIISSSAPTANKQPPLLFIANGIVYPGTFSLHSGNVYKAAGWGTGSDFGDIHSGGDKIYVGSQKLTWQSGGAGSIGTWQYYQDSTDLYIYCDAHPDYRLVVVENWMDTKLRVQASDIEGYSDSFSEYWEIDGWKGGVYDQILRVLQGKGKEVRFIHRTDGYTYIKAASSIGRGEDAEALPRFDASRITQITSQDTTGSSVENLLVLGRGDGIAQAARSSISSNMRGGARLIKSETLGNFTNANLETALALFNTGEGPMAYQVSAPFDEGAGLSDGDYCFIEPEAEGRKRVRVKEWTVSDGSSGITREFWMNQRKKDVIDYLKAQKSLWEDLNNSMQRRMVAWSESLRENIDYSSVDPVVGNAYSVIWDFEIPNTLDPDYQKVFDLRIGLENFEASTTSVTTRTHSHGGCTGSGGSSSHGNAGTGGGHWHNVTGTSTGTTGSTRQAIVSLGTMSSHDGHSHAGPSHSHSITTTNMSAGGHTHSVTTAPGTTGSGGGWSTSHNHNGSTGSSGTGSTSAAGSHNHSFPWAAPDSFPTETHTHDVSGQTTATHAGHGDHSVSANPAHDLPVNAQANELDSVEYYKALLAEKAASVAYFEVFVYMKNSAGAWVQVSSSPYQNKAIGDSWSVDISSYVLSPGSNSIKFAVREWGGSSPVRCRISASLSVMYSIDPYAI